MSSSLQRKAPGLLGLAAMLSLALLLCLSAACGSEDDSGSDREDETDRTEDRGDDGGSGFLGAAPETAGETGGGASEAGSVSSSASGAASSATAAGEVDSAPLDLTRETVALKGIVLASVSVGGKHTCGVMPDGSVECWGDDEFGQSAPPEGGFTAVSAGVGLHLRAEVERLRGMLGRSAAVRPGVAAGGGVRLHQRRAQPYLRAEAGRLRGMLGP